jgi:hypothetical protein
MYSEELIRAGYYYNTALINPEVNMESGVVRNLERLHYPKIYIRTSQENYTHDMGKQFGWRTTETTRRLIISDLVEYVREHTHLINDLQTIEEMLTFVRNAKGKPCAISGGYDDLVMAYAIALATALSGQQNKVSLQKTIDYDKLKKMPKDFQEDFWNMNKIQRMAFAEKHNILK